MPNGTSAIVVSNDNKHWRLHLTIPGADSGLQLVFNIEQYEYVSFRSQDAGIKV